MKKNLKQALVPLAVMVFGAAAAFATNAAKQSEKALALDGYHYDALTETCTSVGEFDCVVIAAGTPICTDINNVQIWGSTDDGTTCSTMLYKRF